MENQEKLSLKMSNQQNSMENYLEWWCQTFVLIFYAYCELYRETKYILQVQLSKDELCRNGSVYLATPDISQSITGKLQWKSQYAKIQQR